ncbi:hypothetical protein BGZ95_007308, partial [Linnemannia exigua]
HQLKRQQSNDQQYPSKRHNHQLQLQKQKEIEEAKKQKEIEQAKKQKEIEQAKKQKEVEQAKAKKQQDHLKQQQRASESDNEDIIGEYFLTFPDIKSMVEAALGAKVEIATAKKPATSSAPAPTKAVEPKPSAAESKTASTPSSTHSSPELRAADILQQRQQRQREHDISVEDKLSTLNQIESSLDDLSRELDEVIAGHIENKKQILQTEENLTKAMFRIDSVESDGEVSVRRRRKELIKKSQALLDVVDQFKAGNVSATTNTATTTTTAAAAEYTAVPEVDSTPATENDVEMTSVANETESTEVPATEAEPAVESTNVTAESTEEDHEEDHEDNHEETELLDTLSDIESLPDTEAGHAHHDGVDETTTSDASDASVETAPIETPASESISTESEHESEEESGQESDAEDKEDEAPQADPLDLIIDAALDLARSSDPIDHDFEMVLVH